MSILKTCIAAAALTLSVATVGAVSTAHAAPRVQVVVDPPLFIPSAEFRYDDSGYYRTNHGHYYHYDRDRNGWRYGRNYREHQRWEKRHRHDHDRRR